MMETRYTYKGQDITTDLMFKIEHIVTLLAERGNQDFDTALSEFLASKTYHALQQTDNLLWAESSEFIADEYGRECQASKAPTTPRAEAFGCMKGQIWMADDFNAPLDDFKEYM